MIRFLYYLSYPFLKLLSSLWESVYFIRRRLYHTRVLKSHSVSMPVISIGNLSHGGTGKTPLTLWLGQVLLDYSYVPAVVMRGYKSQVENSFACIDPKKANFLSSDEFGDEALMLARKLNNGYVLVGKNRYENILRYYSSLNFNCIILDDGYQHLKIRRNLNILLLDATTPLLKYKTPPLGQLREGLSASEDADLIIFTKSDSVSHAYQKKLVEWISKYSNRNGKKQECFFMSYKPTELVKCKSENDEHSEQVKLEDLKQKRVILFCGLASPQSFHQSIKSIGVVQVETANYPDHYQFTQADIDDLNRRAKSSESILICTEKDIVKIQSLDNTDHIYYLKVEVDFGAREEQLKELILNSI